jgi:pyruvate/2-oxoglutarate dehydrogenase complex dihydrolipoamide dehydrogenase (E3) component
MIDNTTKNGPLRDFCIIGGGAGGFYIARKLLQLGLKVTLIEKNNIGGDCLFYGCIPSKTLIALAKKIHDARNATICKTTQSSPIILSEIRSTIQDTIKHIYDSQKVEDLISQGLEIIYGNARFVDPKSVEVDGQMIRARKFVIATGSSPKIPDLPGLHEIEFLTNETVFALSDLPKSLIVVGGGPVGLEFAQSFQRLGTQVNVIQSSQILAKDDQTIVDVLRQRLICEGVKLYENAKLDSVSRENGGIQALVTQNGIPQNIQAERILFATGRKSNVQNLGLEQALIHYSEKGIIVNSHMLTSNHDVYAIGDVTGQYQLTHAAQAEADHVVRHALMIRDPEFNPQLIPWITYTDPELAHVGFSEDQLKEKGIRYTSISVDMDTIDRAYARRILDGRVKILLTPGGKVLGATMVADMAGELIIPLAMAIKFNIKASSLSRVAIPYPTLSEIHKHIADEFVMAFQRRKWKKIATKIIFHAANAFRKIIRKCSKA